MTDALLAIYLIGFGAMFVKVNGFKVEGESLAVHLAGVFLASVLWPVIVLGWVFVALSYPDSE